MKRQTVFMPAKLWDALAAAAKENRLNRPEYLRQLAARDVRDERVCARASA